ncbi:hypothetical protein Emed_000481 [Eimeria media]
MQLSGLPRPSHLPQQSLDRAQLTDKADPDTGCLSRNAPRGSLREAAAATGSPQACWRNGKHGKQTQDDALSLLAFYSSLPLFTQKSLQVTQQHERLYADAAWSNEAPLESSYTASYKPPPPEGFTPLLLPQPLQQQQQEMRKRSVAACIVDEKLGLL